MKNWKKICIMLLCAALCTAGVSTEPFVAVAADTNETIYKVNNGYIEYSINASNGAFGIRTLTGHPQKNKDDNKILLYEGEGTETSFTTIRINGEDYIFGQDYGYFGIDSKLDQPIVNKAEKSISTTYHIKGIAVTQKVMISDDPDNNLCGNAGFGYTIVNESGEHKNVGIRTLLDVAIGENDAPIMVKDVQQSPMKTEEEFTGEHIPSQIRGLNDAVKASQMSYLFLDGWNKLGNTKPDKVILGHWANMANTRYDYTADKNCDFSNYSNQYRSPDSAVSLYWSEQKLEAKGSRSGEFLYGIGNFTDALKNQPVNINMTVQGVQVNASEEGYAKDGIFEVTAEIDNTVDNASTLLSPIVKLSLEAGLTIVEGEESLSFENINKGETKTIRWKLKAEPQKKITAKEISVLLTTGDSAVSANRFIMLPSVSKNVPNISFTKVTPDKYYYQGVKNVTISGELKELMDPLKKKNGWDIKLVKDKTKEEIAIDKAKTAFVEGGKSLSLTTEEELSLGDWTVVFVFTDEDLAKAFGKEIRVPQKIEVVNDEDLLNKSYAILGIERYEVDHYRWVSFDTEEDLQAYREKNGLNKKETPEREMLMEIRGNVQRFRTPQNEEYYTANPDTGNGVVLNNTAQYSKGDPLVIRKKGNNIQISGKGRLSVVNNMTFWNSNFEINFTDGDLQTLNEEKVVGESERVRIDYLGIGEIIQNLGGFAINLKYGEFIELWKDDTRQGNALDFGGKIALSFVKKQDKQENLTGAPDDSGEDEDDGEYMLSADIENVLFGQKKDSVSFLGINATMGFGMPKNALGGFIENPPLEAFLTINTLDDIYEVSLGVDVFVVSCSGSLRVKVEDIKGVKVPLPDKFALSIEGESAAGVPIVPGVLTLNGLSGGYDNLASTVAGKFTDGLPDLTLMLGAKLNLVGVLDGGFDMELGLKGLKLDGELSLSGVDGVFLRGGMEAKWVDPFYLYAYGEISIFDVINGGVSMSLTEDYFYGYGHLTLQIPGSVPIIGNMKLAEVEGALSTQYVGMNVSLLRIKMGVAYYWDDNKVDFDNDLDLSVPPLPKGRSAFYNTNGVYKLDNGTEQKYDIAYGSNFRKLKVQEVSTSKQRKKNRSVAGFNEVNSVAFKLNPKGQDALLMEVPFEGTGTPDKDTLKFTINDEVVPLVLDTSMSDSKNPVQGNYLVQSRNGKQYIYLTVTDEKHLQEGDKTFKLASSSTNIQLGQIAVQSVLNIPELGEMAIGTIHDKKTDVTWTLNDEGEKTKNSKVNLYLTNNKDVVDKIQNQEDTSTIDLGISLGTYPAMDKKARVDIPETLESGDYYVIATMLIPDAGTNIKVSKDKQHFENDSLPEAVKNATLENAGDGGFKLKIEDSEAKKYTNYVVRLLDDQDAEVENSIGYYKTGEDIRIGSQGSAKLLPGVAYKAEIITVNEIKDKGKAYGDDAFMTESVKLAKANNPKLVNIKSNIVGLGEVSDVKDFEVTYTFDQPVQLQMLVNQSPVTKNEEYKKEWTIHHKVEDGDYSVSIMAVNKQGDTYQEVDAEATLGFVVDTTPPQLMISQETADSTQETKLAFSGQTIHVKDGKFKVHGISEAEVSLILKESVADIIVDQNGNFEISGTMDMRNLLNTTRVLEAVDKAGNRSEVSLYFENGDIDTFDSLKLMVQDEKGLHEPELGNQGFGELQAETGQSIQLIPVAYYTDTKGKKQSFKLSQEDVEWFVTGTGNLADFNRGTYHVKMPGTLCIGASLSSGTFLKAEGEVYSQIDDIIQINVKGEELTFIDVPEVRLQADTETLSKSQKIAISPIVPDGDAVAKVEVAKDSGYFMDITNTYKNGYEVKENGTYVFKVTTKANVVSDIMSEESAIRFTNIDTNIPKLKVKTMDYEAGSWTKEKVILQFFNENTANLGETAYYYSVVKNPVDKDWIRVTGNELFINNEVNTEYILKAVSQSGVESAYEKVKIRIDSSAPTGSIHVVKNEFKDFIRDITADYFFDKPVKVTIDADDSGSGVKTIEYLVSESVLSEEELKKATFTSYETFYLGIDENVVVYAKLTDMLGNVSIINTEGLIIDGRAPELSVKPDYDMQDKYSPKGIAVRIKASDDLAGINTITYTTDEAHPQAGKLKLDKNGEGTIVMKNNGTYHLTITAYDNTLKGNDEGYNSGNPIVKKIPVKIDAMQPEFTLDTNGYDAEKWCEGPIRVTIQMNVMNTSGQTTEVFKNGNSLGYMNGNNYLIKKNGSYVFVVTSGAGLEARKEISINKMDDTLPNPPVIENAKEFENKWYKNNKNIKVSFDKTVGCEEWLEVSVDGINYERLTTYEYIADQSGANRYYFRTKDELGRTSPSCAVTVSIGNEPNETEHTVNTGYQVNSAQYLWAMVITTALCLLWSRMKKHKEKAV